jgi:hypothetical protein
VARTNMLARSVQELGLAAWFGRSLISVLDSKETVGHGPGRIGSTPVTLAAIGAYLSGSFFVMTGNKGRLASQQGVATISAVKISVISAALMATACSRRVEGRVSAARTAVARRGTGPEVADAERRLRTLRRSTVALTGALVVFNAVMGEMQRPSEVASGVLRRLVTGRR